MPSRRVFVAALVGVCIALPGLVLTESAEARYMPFSTGYRAIYFNTQSVKGETEGVDQWGLGHCGRYVLSRVECEPWVKGDEFDHGIPGFFEPDGTYQHVRFIYLHFRCNWMAAAHWRGRFVVVNRRGVSCEEWYDESRTQE